MVPELPSPPQRARPFHSHSIQTPASPFSIAKGVQTQASPFHLSRSVIRSSTLVFWVGHLFQPFFIIVWWLDCLFCRCPGPKPVLSSLAQEAIAFHCHRVPDSFQLPLVMDSWKFVLEIHWTWSELHLSLFDIGRVFFWKERGLGRFSWALQDPARNHPPCREARRAYLSFFYFCRYRFVLAVLWVQATGRRWYLLRVVILSMLVCRYHLRPSFRPWVTVTRQESDLLSRPLVSALKL